MLLRALFIIAFTITVSGVQAQDVGWCHPKAQTARVLASPNPHDIHPDWLGESNVGMSTPLKPVRIVEGRVGTYINGDLYTTRGNLSLIGVFVLADEWECQ
jgi:hypothetical protein